MAFKEKLKTEYVLKHHPFPIRERGNGEYRTYVVDKTGVKTRIQRAHKETLIDFLYDFYRNESKPPMTLRMAEDGFIAYKKDVFGIEVGTVLRLTYTSNFFKEIENRKISSLAQDELRIFIREHAEKTRPREEALKAAVQLMHGTFRFAKDQGEIQVDPSESIQAKEFFKYCDNTVKTADERIFSQEEINAIFEEMEKKDNPRALAVQLSILTGMRSGEIVALHRDDISEDYIHIHRQQQLVKDENGKRKGFIELPYTKDERRHPHGGRLFPMTDAIRTLIEKIERCCPEGKGNYLLTDKNGNWISKTSYEHFLTRQMQSMGYHITNNHAFRKSLNSNVLIPTGLTVAERAAVLGHSVETNERFYSFTRSAQVTEIAEKLKKASPTFTQ